MPKNKNDVLLGVLIALAIPFLLGGGCEPDTDGDGVVNVSDNCPDTANADQADSDGDGVGDVCEDPGEALAEEILAQLPSPDAKAVAVLSPTASLPDSLAGVLLDDGTHIYLFGTTTASGDASITGASYYDSDGTFIAHEELITGGISLTIATGDAFEFRETENGLEFTYTLNATTPPSTVVVHISGEDITLDEARSQISTDPNPLYGGSIALGQELTLSPNAISMRVSAQIVSPETCLLGVEAAVTLVDAGCIVESFLNLPALTRRATSVVAEKIVAAFEDKGISQETAIGIETAVSTGYFMVDVLAEGLSPVGLFCHAFGLLQDHSQLVHDQSLAQVICGCEEQTCPGNQPYIGAECRCECEEMPCAADEIFHPFNCECTNECDFVWPHEPCNAAQVREPGTCYCICPEPDDCPEDKRRNKDTCECECFEQLDCSDIGKVFSNDTCACKDACSPPKTFFNEITQQCECDPGLALGCELGQQLNDFACQCVCIDTRCPG